MTHKHTYFRPTIPQQRRLLFEMWEAHGNVEAACKQARVSIRTFYYWKPRFEEGGYEALKETRSHAPKNPHRTPKDVETQIIELKMARPDWGKLRIAKEVAQSDNSVESISPNTVRRVLEDAGLWPKTSLTKAQ